MIQNYIQRLKDEWREGGPFWFFMGKITITNTWTGAKCSLPLLPLMALVAWALAVIFT